MKERNVTLDLIRTIAILFVIIVHSLKFLGYYNVIFIDKSLYLYTAIRWITYTCVPLFIMLTGYLQNKKVPDKAYYKSILRVLITYVVIAILTIMFKTILLKEKITIVEAIISIIDFNSIGYAWYVEMYIGLFMIIPFINIMYNNIPTKKNKQILICSFLVITSLSILIKSIKIGTICIKDAPDYWECIYPITYYLIGAYISEYKIRTNIKKTILFSFIYIIIIDIITFKFNYGNAYDWAFLGSYSCITTVILAVAIFLILLNVSIKNNIIKKIVTSISINSFDMYLFSYSIDIICYNLLTKYCPYEIKIWYMIFMVPIVFISSYAISYLKNLIFKYIKKLISKLKGRKDEENINNYSDIQRRELPEKVLK